jgi:hypothetical protein
MPSPENDLGYCVARQLGGRAQPVIDASFAVCDPGLLEVAIQHGAPKRRSCRMR